MGVSFAFSVGGLVGGFQGKPKGKPPFFVLGWGVGGSHWFWLHVSQRATLSPCQLKMLLEPEGEADGISKSAGDIGEEIWF